MNPNGQPNFGSAPPPVGMGGGGGAPVAGSPKEQVNIPGLILMIGGIGGVLFNIYGIVQSTAARGQIEAALSNSPDAEKMRPIMEAVLKIMPLFSIVGIALCALMAFGGMKMRNLQGWGLSLAGCVAGCIPCCASYCCILTLVGGIWGLIVINKADVKAAFTA